MLCWQGLPGNRMSRRWPGRFLPVPSPWCLWAMTGSSEITKIITFYQRG